MPNELRLDKDTKEGTFIPDLIDLIEIRDLDIHVKDFTSYDLRIEIEQTDDEIWISILEKEGD